MHETKSAVFTAERNATTNLTIVFRLSVNDLRVVRVLSATRGVMIKISTTDSYIGAPENDIDTKRNCQFPLATYVRSTSEVGFVQLSLIYMPTFSF